LATRGAQRVGDEAAATAPLGATLWGLGRTLAQEHPDLLARLIDLPPAVDPDGDAARLDGELDQPDGEPEVALRTQRWVPRLDAAPAPLDPPPLRPDGTYLLTGALGALGLRVARGLARRGARRLILLGRTPLPPRSRWSELAPASRAAEQVAAIREIEALGVTVHLGAVDVGAEEELAAFLARFRDEAWPPIRGVVHLAGVLQDGVLAHLDGAALAEVFRAKVAGAWALHQLLAREPLEFFVLFSSLAGLLGSAGQGNYAAANAFLDGLAHHRAALGAPALAIDWGPWEELGLTAGQGERLARQGIGSIDPERGIDLFLRLLGARGQLAVVPFDWARLPRTIAALPLLDGVRPERGPAPRPSGLREQLRSLPPVERERELSAILSRRIGEALGATDAVRTDQPLDRLGLDSLMGIELRSQLEAELGMAVDAGLLLSGPTIVQLAAALRAQIDGDPPAELAPTGEEPPQITAIRPAGARPPFFCVHPGALGASIYTGLAELLGPDQPFFSLCPRELEAAYTVAEGPAVAQASIEQLAARCIAVLRATQPAGPYRLGGWSLGGVLAFEMARQLRAAGEQIALLALFDSPTPSAAAAGEVADKTLVPAFASYLGARHGVSFPGHQIAWGALSLDERLAAVHDWGSRSALFPPEQGAERLRSLLSAYRLGLRNAVSHLHDYRPEVYAGRIVYFRATRSLEAYDEAFPRPASAWSAWTSQPLELVDIHGDHYSMFLDPYVQSFAAEFARVLHGAEGGAA
jgi:thioesterase domain-containing protein/NAD(P)-dependent dehydrogenase (short-subunit alcohol dehydrogenase family)/acyl carrier protein